MVGLFDDFVVGAGSSMGVAVGIEVVLADSRLVRVSADGNADGAVDGSFVGPKHDTCTTSFLRVQPQGSVPWNTSFLANTEQF